MKYNQAPLPFQGQKRRFLKKFKEALKSVPDGAVFVDLFGGSGLLSHTVKQERPSARVVYNDFDNYAQRLAHVDQTNRIVADLRFLTAAHADNARLPDTVKRQVLARIAQERGFVDYITLSSNLLFSGKFANSMRELEREGMYSKVRQSDYVTDGYLEGVELVRKDYKELAAEYAGGNVVFLVDPPYLSTDCSTYGSDKYWKLGDYLDVLTVLEEGSYFYFTSNKSQVLELCDWMSTHTSYENPFAKAAINTTGGSVNYNSSYTDIMVWKWGGDE